jgi:hypothetical protein
VAHGGFFAGCCSGFGVNARSGPSGENPRGSMHWEVNGRQAAIGAVGEYSVSPGERRAGTMLATIEDGGAGADTYFSIGPGPGSTLPDCATATFDNQGTVGEFVVNDAQP